MLMLCRCILARHDACTSIHNVSDAADANSASGEAEWETAQKNAYGLTAGRLQYLVEVLHCQNNHQRIEEANAQPEFVSDFAVFGCEYALRPQLPIATG